MDWNVPIEAARPKVLRSDRYAFCWSPKEGDGQGDLLCRLRIDDTLVARMELAWPNRASATLQRVELPLSRLPNDEPDVAAVTCLDRHLGPGKTTIIDHATGRGRRVWQLTESGGQVSLASHTIAVTNGAIQRRTAAWNRELAQIIRVLDRCAP